MSVTRRPGGQRPSGSRSSQRRACPRAGATSLLSGAHSEGRLVRPRHSRSRPSLVRTAGRWGGSECLQSRSLLRGQTAAPCRALDPTQVHPFSSEGQKVKVTALAGFASPTGRERRLRPRPLPAAGRWLPVCFLFPRPGLSAVCAKSRTSSQHRPGQLTNAGAPRPASASSL